MAFSSLRVLAGATLLAAVFANPASAQLSFDPVDEVLGTLGITGRSRPHIDYRERAPLVVPKSGTGLRPPEERAAGRGQRWPNDPDVAARRRAAEDDRAPRVTEDLYVRDGGKARSRYAGVPTKGQQGGDGDGGAYNPARAISPEQLRQIQASAEVTAVPTGGEPRREVLTDPPKGYRRATGPKVKADFEPMRSGDDVQINVNVPRN